MNSVYPEEENIILLDNYYTNVKQISEDYLKYITNYKIATGEYLKKLLLNQEKFRPRLLEPVDQPKHINIGHLISIASIVPKVIDQQIINIEYFVEGIEPKFDKFEKLLKEKSTEFIDIENSYKDIKNELNKKYREIDKLKANYMANINMAEETIHKFYMKQNSKKKSSTKLNFSQMDANDSTSGNFEDQVNLSIQKTKRIEEEYKANIFSVKTLEKKYIETAEKSKESLISILCVFSNNLKDLISDCMVFLRNSFKIPLSEIDMYLSELVNLDEFSKFKKDILSSYKNNNNLKPIFPEKYTLKIYQGKNNNANRGFHKSNSHSNSKRKSSCIQSEEELQELDFVQEEEIFMTIKKMMENFELLDNNNYDLTLEEEKLRCKYLTLKILSFAPISKMYSNKIPSITEEEVKEIDEMLKKRQNRVIFIQKLSQFRTRGIFEIPEREYSILSRLFNSIAKTVESDMDYDCAINIIILSQTYYLLKNNNKEYLQNAIMNNELFKKKQFWETFAQYSIEKEIAQNKETDSKNGENLNNKEYEEKCKNIVFSQLFPITNNMIDFGLDINIVEEIVVPLIDQYKISPELAEAVLSTINMKK